MGAFAVVPPTTIAIFGGTGNLMETKLLPALFRLYRAGALPKQFHIVGISRKSFSDDEYRQYLSRALPSGVDGFMSHFMYQRGAFDDIETYNALTMRLANIDTAAGVCTNKLFYLAVPPQLYSGIFTHLADCGAMTLCNGVDAWSRLLVEKPFGRDLATAEALEKQLREQYAEEQIYRIDHYLAKDAIENIIALRFANRILADSWHKGEVASIFIRALETKDVASRGAFYDGVGALRDVGQNHLLQILALLTMSAVDLRDVVALRAARERVLSALMPPVEVCFGQYDGYRDTPGVAVDSLTETYFKLTTTLAHPEWEGVPITLESGKALDVNRTEAVVTFRSREECFCAAAPAPHEHHNQLAITIAPEQRIILTVFVKRPGFAYALEPQELVLTQSPGSDDYSPEAYERVLYDCLIGEQARFVSSGEVAAAWRFITPLLSASSRKLSPYSPGSSGPIIN